ncbi:Proteasome subunit beta type-6 [Microbotryomycetes sp. JL221]|nr:Proteasome subunit beta type-6 [Microbotryomycetes sp. JL221]
MAALVQGVAASSAASGPQQRSFNPYSDNGGTILAISSSDFCLIAADTRQSEGYSIQTRTARKVFQLTDNVVMAVVGFQADGTALQKRLKQRLEWYYHEHGEQLSLPSIARLVQTMLYGKRFFPYYANVILGGIHPDGTGGVYSFDPVGSYERESCRAAGAASSLVQPFLDNMVYGKNQQPDPALPAADKDARPVLEYDKVRSLVVDAFTGATERQIEVGDGLIVIALRKGQPIEETYLPLKRD